MKLLKHLRLPLQRNDISKEINRLILPIILENALQISSGLVATAMIGRLLSSDISGQGACVRITDILWFLFKGIGIGTTALIARAYGEGNFKKCKVYFEQGIITVIPLALLLQVILLCFSKPLLRFLTTEQDIIDKAEQYMHILIIGFPAIAIMFLVTAVFHGHGNTKTPMYIAGIVNLINLSIGYTIIFGKLGVSPMGLQGAAIAMVISQYCGAFLGLFLLYSFGPFSKRIILGLPPFRFRFSGSIIFDLYTTGLPPGFEIILWQLSTIILSKVILSYGADYFAAYQLGIQAESLTEMPAIGFGIASMTLIAKAIGKKDKLLCKKYLKQIEKFTLYISIVTTLSLIFLPHVFMSLLTNKPVLQEIGIVYIVVMGFIQIPQNFSRVFNGTLRAAGFKNVSMYVAFGGIWIVRIPLSILVAYQLHWDIIFIWIAIALDQTVKCITSYCIFRKNVEWYRNCSKSVCSNTICN